jgi:hypothetical protein
MEKLCRTISCDTVLVKFLISFDSQIFNFIVIVAFSGGDCACFLRSPRAFFSQCHWLMQMP